MGRPLAIEFDRVTKQFGSCVANDSVSFQVEAGSIHALIGENGAGKSTAMKLLYGLLSPTSGTIRVKGKAANWKTPADAIAQGVGMVQQHFALGEPFSVTENIILGAEPKPKAKWFWKWVPSMFWPVGRHQVAETIHAHAQALGKESLQLDTAVETLGVGARQRVEILKLLYRNAEILILDEPTAVLTPPEVEELFVYLRTCRERGQTILLITHKLKEVQAIADAVTVFRRGQVVWSGELKQTSLHELSLAMVGRHVELDRYFPPKQKPGDVVLSVKRAGTEFDLRAGEILGVAGVEGNGQSELIHELWSGNYENVDVLIPEDRHREALLLSQSASENFLLGQEQNPKWAFGPMRAFLRKDRLTQATESAMTAWDVRPVDPQLSLGNFSGGNQQKFIFARAFSAQAQRRASVSADSGASHAGRVWIIAQPTRGVDIGAMEGIHAKIREIRDQGGAVLLISSDLDEVCALSDRMLVLFRGKIVDRLERADISSQRLGLALAGGHSS